MIYNIHTRDYLRACELRGERGNEAEGSESTNPLAKKLEVGRRGAPGEQSCPLGELLGYFMSVYKAFLYKTITRYKVRALDSNNRRSEEENLLKNMEIDVRLRTDVE